MQRALRLIGLFAAGTLVYVLCGSSCIPYKWINAEGLLFGRSITVRVDRPLAQHMISDPAQADVLALFAAYDPLPLTTPTLARIAAEHSMDAATLYFLQRAYQDARNRTVQDAYLRNLDALSGSNVGVALADLRGHFVAFVPGLDYLDTTNGGDFARQRRLLSAQGVANELIKTDPWGFADANAEVVAERLRSLGQQHPRIIVVSASKGGLETALALGLIMDPVETCSISAWVSVGGILKGSPVADTYLHWPKCWLAEIGLLFVGQKIDLVQDVSYATRSNASDALVYPEHLMRLHFVGAPLVSQVQKRIGDHFCSIKAYGPNDGITPLADEVSAGGLIVSELGLDHYYQSPDIDQKTIALAMVVAAKSQDPQQGH